MLRFDPMHSWGYSRTMLLLCCLGNKEMFFTEHTWHLFFRYNVEKITFIKSMGRPPRQSSADVIYHVINRSNARLEIFHNDKDHEAFERILEEAKLKHLLRTYSYAIMPNRHLILSSCKDGNISKFMHWLTLLTLKDGIPTTTALEEVIFIREDSNLFRLKKINISFSFAGMLKEIHSE